MKILFYLLTILCSSLGFLTLIRSVEALLSDGRIMSSQIIIAIISLFLGVFFLNKARVK